MCACRTTSHRAIASQMALAIVERLRATPGVRAAGAGDMAPFGSMLSRFGFRLPGVSDADGRPVVATSLRAVITPGYAEALGMRLREGRLLRAGDLTVTSRAILVNASFARAYFTDGRPAGRPAFCRACFPVARTGHRRRGGRRRRRHAAGRPRRSAAAADLRGAGRRSADWAPHAGREDRRRCVPRWRRSCRRLVGRWRPGATVERMGPLASKLVRVRSRPHASRRPCSRRSRSWRWRSLRRGSCGALVLRHRAAPPGDRRAHGARRDARRRRPA